MKAIYNDPARRLLEKLPKTALVDVAIELLRKGGTRAVTEHEAYAVIVPIAILLDIKLPDPQNVPGCKDGRCCTPQRKRAHR